MDFDRALGNAVGCLLLIGFSLGILATASVFLIAHWYLR